MKKKLIGSNIQPKCEYCKHSVALQESDTVLCPLAGVTVSDNACKKFKYDPLKRKPRSAPVLTQYSEEDFSLE